MNRFCLESRTLSLALLASATALCSTAFAAPARVEAFDVATWKQMNGPGASAAVIVFTATTCAYCPAVIDRLATAIQHRRVRAPLVAVVTDATAGDDDATLLADAHYRLADRLLAFSGPERTLRYAVNPQWRGITPYVAFVSPGGEVRWVLGAPADADVQAWLAQVEVKPRP